MHISSEHLTKTDPGTKLSFQVIYSLVIHTEHPMILTSDLRTANRLRKTLLVWLTSCVFLDLLVLSVRCPLPVARSVGLSFCFLMLMDHGSWIVDGSAFVLRPRYVRSTP